MASNKIKTNTDSLQKTQDQLRQELKAIETAIDKINEDMNIMNASWAGEAHDTFVGSVNDDFAALKELCEGIQAIIDYEGTAVTEYTKCEQKVSDIVSQIRV